MNLVGSKFDARPHVVPVTINPVQSARDAQFAIHSIGSVGVDVVYGEPGRYVAPTCVLLVYVLYSLAVSRPSIKYNVFDVGGDDIIPSMVEARWHVFDVVPVSYMKPTHFGVLPRLFEDSHWIIQFERMLFPVTFL